MLSLLVRELTTHASWACDSLALLRDGDDNDDEIGVYDADEANFILESTARALSKVVGGGGGKDVLSFVVEKLPQITVR